jgi:hypothetical protein
MNLKFIDFFNSSSTVKEKGKKHKEKDKEDEEEEEEDEESSENEENDYEQGGFGEEDLIGNIELLELSTDFDFGDFGLSSFDFSGIDLDFMSNFKLGDAFSGDWMESLSNIAESIGTDLGNVGAAFLEVLTQ